MNELLRGLSTQDIRSNPEFYQVRSSYEGIAQIANELEQRVVGQRPALEAISRGVIRAESGMSRKDKPLFTGLFLGPTGVGKTETAKALAQYLHPKGEEWRDHFLRIDCAEFKQDHDVHRITGSPNSYVGYGDPVLITPEFVQQKNTVLLIDEVDQASPGFHDWLYSVLDEGEFRARVGSGQSGANKHAEEAVISLRDTFIILTSNVGAGEMQDARKGKKGIGFGSGVRHGDISEAGMKALEERFRQKPAMLGRIDAIIPFNELQPEHFEAIFNRYMDEINSEQSYGWNFVATTHELRDALIAKAVGEGKYGGRDIRRTIDQFVLSKVAELRWEGALAEGQPIIGDVATEEDIPLNVKQGDVIFWTSGLRLDNPQKDKEGPLVVAKRVREEQQTPQTKLTVIEGSKKDDQPDRDPGSYIGNKPPTEDEDEDEDGSDDSGDKRISFYLPIGKAVLGLDHGSRLSMKQTITIFDGEQPIMFQAVENMPLIELGPVE